MQTEIDQYLAQQNELLNQQNKLLAEQNALLMQQVDSLKNVLNSYDKLNQGLNNKINSLETENETKKELISAMKLELLKLEQGKFSEQLQQAFQNNVLIQLQTQLTQALKQLNLNNIISDLVKAELKPIQSNNNTQQTDLEKALLKISQVKVPDNFYKDLEMQSERIGMLAKTVEGLIKLINNLKD